MGGELQAIIDSDRNGLMHTGPQKVTSTACHWMHLGTGELSDQSEFRYSLHDAQQSAQMVSADEGVDLPVTGAPFGIRDGRLGIDAEMAWCPATTIIGAESLCAFFMEVEQMAI